MEKLNMNDFKTTREANLMCVKLARKMNELIEENNKLKEKIESLEVVEEENIETVEWSEKIEDYKTGRGQYTFPDGEIINGKDDAQAYLEAKMS